MNFPATVSCDFETSFCGFTQASDDVFDWTRHSGSTTSSNTGPSDDHTPGGKVTKVSSLKKQNL